MHQLCHECAEVWSWLTSTAGALWLLLTSSLSFAWNAVASFFGSMNVFTFVFLASAASIALNGEKVAIAAYRYRKQRRGWPTYRPIDVVALYLAVAAALTVGGYVLYHAALIVASALAGFMLAWWMRQWWQEPDDEAEYWRRFRR